MRAISPVIATVIIVSIAIALAIAVALWMAGITTTVSQFERLDITAAYVDTTFANTNYYKIVLEVKNLGSTTASIDMVFVNNKPLGDTQYITDETTQLTGNEHWSIVDETGATVPQPPATIEPGGRATVYIYLLKEEAGGPYTAGQIVQITVHTASGGQYPKAVNLP